MPSGIMLNAPIKYIMLAVIMLSFLNLPMIKNITHPFISFTIMTHAILYSQLILTNLEKVIKNRAYLEKLHLGVILSLIWFLEMRWF